MELWCLLDGVASGRIVKLRFYISLTCEEKNFEDRDYRPYFLLLHPLSEKTKKQFTVVCLTKPQSR
ncbi:MAG: hypothetical protein U9O89_04655 [Thermoproteota archaeon]|nr:hypothetical protein [Thermoproteota archaeon]